MSKKKPQTAANPAGDGTKKKDAPIIVEEMAHYTHRFSPDELNNLGGELASALTDKENLDNDKKSIVSEFNSKIEEKNGTISKLKNLRQSGEESRQGKCRVVKDFEAGTKQFFLLPGGELVKEGKIEQSDYTLHFPTVKLSPEEEEELAK